jgi:glycosyltransferase domain-containing protein
MIAIFIITYNRPEFLKRSITYYSKKSELLTEVIFHIYDASDEINYIKNFNEIKKFANLQINHVRYVNQKNEYKRLYDSTQNINEEYVLLVGDDDFIIAESLKPAKIFLDLNKNYIACSGMRTSFSLENSDEDGVKGTNVKILRTVPGPYWSLDNPIINFITYMRTGIPMQHFLMRNEAHREIYAHLGDDKFKTSLLSQDLLPCAILSTLGNIKRLDHVLSFIRNENNVSTYKYIDEIIEDDDFSKTLVNSKNLIFEKLIKHNYNSDSLKQIINREFTIRLTQLFQWAQENKYFELGDDIKKFWDFQNQNKYIPSTQMYYNTIIRDIYEACKRG